MFKDYDKYLSTSLKVYILVLVIVFIMKIVGLDYFGIDLNNKAINIIGSFITSNKIINNIFYLMPLIVYQYIIISVVCDDNSKITMRYNIIVMPFMYLMECYKINLFGNFSFVFETLFFLAITYIYCKIYKKNFKLKKFILIMVLFMIIQIISMLTRLNYSLTYVKNPIANLILNLDYIIAMIIYYKIYFWKGGLQKWTDGFREEVSSSLQKLTNLRKLPKQLQRNWHKFKQLTKVDKITFIIYFALTAIWNLLTIVAVILVAMLNDTVIECIFIITSFWLSKRAFGKAFHLSSMIQCFIVSNITYYILNRITTPLGISILIPIMLGVGLSYVTSKLVKKTYKPLYRGMSKETFEETILKIVDKDSLKYKICYDFYINKKSDLSLSMKYNYSVMGIRKIKSRINDKIKEL